MATSMEKVQGIFSKIDGISNNMEWQSAELWTSPRLFGDVTMLKVNKQLNTVELSTLYMEWLIVSICYPWKK